MRRLVLLLILCGLTFVAGVDRLAITDSDEAYYAEAGREMVERGDYLTPYFNYAPRFQKPILFYWAVAGSYLATGVSEVAARAGSALAGLGLVLLAFAAGRRWYDPETGLLAGAIIATSFGCVAMAHAALPDLPLAFFVSAATWAGLVPVVAGPGRAARPRRWWLLAAALAGLGFLTKGPIGLVIPTLVLVPALFVERRWRRLRPATALAMAGVFLLVAGPWYLLMALEHGAPYLRGFFLSDNLERFATSRFNDPRPIWYYLPILLGGLLPWSPFLLLLLPPAWRVLRRAERSTPIGRCLAIWAFVPLVLLTLSVGKQPRYILPVLVPLAILVARALAAHVGEPRGAGARRGTVLFRASVVLTGALLALVGILLFRLEPLIPYASHRLVLASAVLIVLSGFSVGIVGLSSRWRSTALAVTVAGAVTIVTLQYSALAIPGADPVEQMAEHVAMQRRQGEPIAAYRVFARNLIFYTHAQQQDLFDREQVRQFLDSPDRVLCVLPDEDAAAIERDGRVRVRRLATLRFFDAATARPGAILWPDAARDLQTFVLITNR